MLKPPEDLKELCDDLKVCGKRELNLLLRLRHKYQVVRQRETIALQKAEEEANAVKVEIDTDDELDAELEKTI